MKKITIIAICVFVGCYCNAQSAKQDKGRGTADNKANTQVTLPNEKIERTVPVPGGVSSQMDEATAAPLYQEKQTQQRINEPLRNNVKASPEKKK